MKTLKLLLAAAAAILIIQAPAQMPPLSAITNVYTGTGPNTGTGDPAILAFNKIDTNTLILSNAVTQVNMTVKTNVFNVLSYGATRSGRWAPVIALTNVSGTCYLGCSNTIFSNSDVGDDIRVIAANTNGMDFYTTIATVINPNLITLSAMPPQLYTNFFLANYGQHDDTPAFQAAINAAAANGGGVVYAPGGDYLIEGQFLLTNQNNAQIIIPYASTQAPWYDDSPTIEIRGDSAPRSWSLGGVSGSTGAVAPSPNETVLSEMVPGDDNTSSNGFASCMFDGRPYNTNAPMEPASNGRTWPENAMNVSVHDFGIAMSFNSHVIALNLIAFPDSIPGGGVWNVSIMGGPVAAPSWWYTNSPVSSNGIAILMPGVFNGTWGRLDDTVISGFYDGVENGLLTSYRLTINNCKNPINTRLQANVVSDFYQLNISDCSNIVVAGASAGGTSIRVHSYAAIQATLVGEGGWWGLANQINAVYDPNGAFNTAYCSMELPYTNSGTEAIVINEPSGYGTSTKGFNVTIENSPTDSRVYSTSSQTFASPVDFTSTFAALSGLGGGWDYQFSDLNVLNNANVAGILSAANYSFAGGDIFNNGGYLWEENQGEIHINPGLIYWKSGSGSSDSTAIEWLYNTAANNVYWTSYFNAGNLSAVWSGLYGASSAHYLEWVDGVNGVVFGSATNAGSGFFCSGGFASLATNSVPFSTTGITNTTLVNICVRGFTGTGVIFTNSITGYHEQEGTITTPMPFTLQSGEALVGTSCAEVGNKGF